MARSIHNDVLDAALDTIALADLLTLCNAEPTTRAEAVTTFALADVALTPGDGGGDYVIADGDTSGRKITVGAQTDFPVDTTGTATHVALVDGTRLLHVTTMTSQALTSGNTVSTAAFDVEIADPTA